MNPQKGESILKDDNKLDEKTQESFDIKEAAKFLGVSVRTLKRWRKSGKLVPDTISQRFLQEPHKRGPKLVTNYSLAQLKLVTNSRYEHQKKVTNSETGAKFSETGVTFQEKGAKFDSEKVTTGQTALVTTSTRTVIEFVSPEKEILFKNTPRISPDTQFSPKDKVSNIIWENGFEIGKYIGVPTIYKSDNFGCIVRLDYDAILNSDEVITGAELSPFDRNVYDSIVTLYVAGNKMFPLQDIWRVFSQNPNAKLTEVERKKLLKSLFHIARYWVTIVTDYSEKTEVWTEKNSKSNEEHGKNFKPERKFYKRLQSNYSGQLLAFQIIGKRCVETVHLNNGQDIIEKETTAEIFELGFCPILYQYAKAKGQVASTSIKLLNTSEKNNKKIAINRGYHNDEITTFLAREIDTMKKSSTYNNIILLERLYIIDGIENIQQGKNDLKKKRKQTRDKIEKILTHFKINGIIKGHIFHKKTFGKALTFYSVEILI